MSYVNSDLDRGKHSDFTAHKRMDWKSTYLAVEKFTLHNVNLCSIHSNVWENGVFSAVLFEHPNTHRQQVECASFSILF